MEFEYSKKTKMYMEQVTDFMGKHIYAAEPVFQEQLNQGATRWQIPPIMEELKAKARERGLWNLFLPESERGAALGLGPRQGAKDTVPEAPAPGGPTWNSSTRRRPRCTWSSSPTS